MQRAVGLTLLVFSGVMIAGLYEFATPEDLEHHWDGSEIRQQDIVAARGPALSRFDAENDTTIIIFNCAHGPCAKAVKLSGDQRVLAAGRSAILKAKSWNEEPLIPPFIVTDPFGRGNVTSVVAIPMQVIQRPFLVALADVSIAVFCTGIALTARNQPRTRVVFAVLPVLIALALVTARESSGDLEAYILPLLAGAVTLLASVLIFAISKRGTALRTGAIALLLFGFSSIAGDILVHPLFPACCGK